MKLRLRKVEAMKWLRHAIIVIASAVSGLDAWLYLDISAARVPIAIIWGKAHAAHYDLVSVYILLAFMPLQFQSLPLFVTVQ